MTLGLLALGVYLSIICVSLVFVALIVWDTRKMGK